MAVGLIVSEIGRGQWWLGHSEIDCNSLKCNLGLIYINELVCILHANDVPSWRRLALSEFSFGHSAQTATVSTHSRAHMFMTPARANNFFGRLYDRLCHSRLVPLPSKHWSPFPLAYNIFLCSQLYASVRMRRHDRYSNPKSTVIVVLLDPDLR